MKVILTQDIKGVGKKDQIINANDGYARNFLFPKKLALEANNENIAKLKGKQDSTNFKKAQEREQAEQIKQKITQNTLTITVKTGENGKIFGSITPKEISTELENQYNIKIDKKKINLKSAIKETGIFNIDIKLYEGVTAKLKIKVDPFGDGPKKAQKN